MSFNLKDLSNHTFELIKMYRSLWTPKCEYLQVCLCQYLCTAKDYCQAKSIEGLSFCVFRTSWRKTFGVIGTCQAYLNLLSINAIDLQNENVQCATVDTKYCYSGFTGNYNLDFASDSQHVLFTFRITLLFWKISFRWNIASFVYKCCVLRNYIEPWKSCHCRRVESLYLQNHHVSWDQKKRQVWSNINIASTKSDRHFNTSLAKNVEKTNNHTWC